MLPIPDGYSPTKTYGLLRQNAAALFVAVKKAVSDEDWKHFDDLKLVQGHLVELDQLHLGEKTYKTIKLPCFDGRFVTLTDDDLCAVINDARVHVIACPKCGSKKRKNDGYPVCLKDAHTMVPITRVSMLNFHFATLEEYLSFNATRKKPYPLIGIVDEQHSPPVPKVETSTDEE